MRKARRILIASLLIAVLYFIIIASDSPSATAQGQPTSIPLATLVPPTLIPPPPTATPFPPLVKSAVARILARDTQNNPPQPMLVVGAPSNMPLFSEINEVGEFEGFEADIARAIAEDWGAKLTFRQVTRTNALDLLQSGEIDLLIGKQVLSRDSQTLLDFSDPIFTGKYQALVMDQTPIKSISELGGKSVGVVIGSAGEQAFAEWAALNGLQADIRRYIMLDDGLRDLSSGDLIAMVDDRWDLHNRVFRKIEGVRLLEGVFRAEPYAIAMIRHDETLRTLVNRTLQRLVAGQRWVPIYERWFKGFSDPSEWVIPAVWKDLDSDKRELDKFPQDILRPERSMIERLKAGEPVRVAGLGIPPGPDGQPTLLERFNTAIVYEMARRWGATVSLIPGSFANPEDVLASGNADLAVGLEPRWGPVERIDYVGIYANRGYRMVTRILSEVSAFGDLFAGSRVVATFADDPQAFELASKLADSANINIRNMIVRTDQDVVDAVFGNQTARILFADALRADALVRANSATLRLVDKLYAPKPMAFAVSRNDADFRVLVDVTLQEMYRDGTYQRLWKENWNLGDPLRILVWPGTTTPFGVKTSN